MQKVIISVVILFFLLLAWLRGIIFLDPDFGWHLKMGELILVKGLPDKDPFSYTMPNFPFVDHEWLSNVSIYFLYHGFGKVALALLYAVFAGLAVLLPIFFLDTRFLALPVILTTGVLLPYIGIRPQVITWFFFSIVLLFVFHQNLWQRGKYLIPVLFVLWVNLHGGFAAGIVILAIFVFLQTIELRKVVLSDLLVLLLSIAATFINPYGARIWGEVWMQFSDSSLHWLIAEWMPPFLTFNPFFTLPLALSTYGIWKYRKKFKMTEVLLFFVLLTGGLSSSRHLPLWILSALPIMAESLKVFWQGLVKVKFARARLKRAYNVLLMVSLALFVFQVWITLQGAVSMSEDNFYPKNAVIFLRQQNFDGNPFSLYEWGGYLIWKLPEKKVFIDGRMPSWRLRSADGSRTLSIFQEYRKVLSDEIDYQSVFAKYNITTVLLSTTEDKDDLVEQWLESVFGSKRQKRTLRERLDRDGWKQIYKDDNALVYQLQV